MNIFSQPVAGLLELLIGVFFFPWVRVGGSMWFADLKFPDQGSNSRPLQWRNSVLTNGPSGNSFKWYLYEQKFLILMKVNLPVFFFNSA